MPSRNPVSLFTRCGVTTPIDAGSIQGLRLAHRRATQPLAIDSLAAPLVLAAIFLGGGVVHGASPPVALSAGAGVSTAYVFIYMLPELSAAGAAFVTASAGRALPAPALRVYGAALVGFLVFYGLENLVSWSGTRTTHDEADRASLRPVVFIHIGGFAVYAWLVSYLMIRGVTNAPVPIVLYTLAMGLHFLGIDHSLRREHGGAYDHVGRFVLAGAVLLGWLVAELTEVAKPLIITGLGLVSGGVVMNSMVMELAGEQEARFWPFTLGALGYAGLLVMAG